MGYRVTVQPSGYSFIVYDHETVLEAANRCGYFFPHQCCMGVCATCKGKLIQGEVDYAGVKLLGLSQQEQSAKYALFCSAKPITDLIIQVDDFAVTSIPSSDLITYDVMHLEQLTQNISKIILQAPPHQHIHYQAGQYIKIMQLDGTGSPMSIACAPFDLSTIELHIHHPKENQRACNLLALAKTEKRFTLRGPFGTCTAAKLGRQPVVFLAHSTGFSPIKAVMEEMLHLNYPPEMHLYWYAELSEEIYLRPLVEEWAKQLKQFHFIFLTPDKVIETILRDHHDLSDTQVYIVDAPDAVYEMQSRLMQAGLKKENCFSDVFDYDPRA